MKRIRLPNIHNLLKMLFQRVVIVSLLLLLQIVLVAVAILRGGSNSIWYWFAMYLVSLVVALYIISNDTNPAYQIGWLASLLFLPLVGSALYLILGGNRLSRRLKRKMGSMQQTMVENLTQDAEMHTWLENKEPDAALQSNYLTQVAGCPGYTGTETEYFSLGDLCFPRMCEELQKAEKYIFVEYFIIEQGFLWQTVLDLLTEKAAQGVDVRVIYDDFGCICRLPYHYRLTLESRGIRCSVFNPFIPVLSSRLNNRDHRKLFIIDGKVAFTGGMNLADEYINIHAPYGHWKDAGILVRGAAAWSMTVMFLSMWEYQTGRRERIEDYRPAPMEVTSQGFIQPYTDNPLDNEPVGQTVYLNLINRAKRYVRIMTPYLIVDTELTTALTNAAKSGIEVTIITPHIPDKWYVHALTRAHYARLVAAGVQIYEYTPGFIHSKVFCVDGVYATVGTINLDFRSLYLHFEDGVWMYKAGCIAEIERDFDQTIPVCQRITLAQCLSRPWYKRLGQAILRLLTPLM